MKINIGGGYKRYDGFVNVDADPLTKPEHIVNLECDWLPFDDSTVSEVKAYHILEHISDGFFHLIQELYRVCEDGALVDIQVPHHRSEMWYGDPTHVRFITVESLRMFSKKRNEWHVKQWNSSSGFGTTLDVDFEIVEYDFIPTGRWLERFKTMSPDEIIEVSNNFCNVYDEIHVKLQCIK